MPPNRAAAPKAMTAQAIPDLDAPIEVRRHPGARRLTLRVSRTRRAVIVTLPVQCDLDEAGNFLHRNMAWVRERLDSLPVPVPFGDGVIMPLRGETHRIVFTGTSQRGAGVVRRLPGDNSGGHYGQLHVNGELDRAPRRLGDWLVDQARRDLDERVAWHSQRLGVRASRISVRDQTSRWGSCSTTGALSFSWRLILAPRNILDYVAAHEVAHLAEMNHGPRFWSLVRRTMPDMDEARRWLQKCGMDLHRYGAVVASV
jgi:predicted metal-dependent hydrolase